MSWRTSVKETNLNKCIGKQFDHSIVFDFLTFNNHSSGEGLKYTFRYLILETSSWSIREENKFQYFAFCILVNSRRVSYSNDDTLTSTNTRRPFFLSKLISKFRCGGGGCKVEYKTIKKDPQKCFSKTLFQML